MTCPVRIGDAAVAVPSGVLAAALPLADPIARAPTQLAYVGYGCGHAASSALSYLT
ncbi:hypothetical protein AB0F65_19795 [Nocardia rhamnosiphila]|uniref:hypothetical protein n=1 Tax=Nocardia rhamnosiphila TaxID=426716 RepID=UPI003407517B